MTIQVTEKEDGSFYISWDQNDPLESVMNDWTEQDFINVIFDHLNRLENKKINNSKKQ